MSEYKLSIIVPTFNLESLITKTFDSIRKQTFGFENIELIFVDDCSNDSTPNIITQYATDYENVKYFKTDYNSGSGGKPRNIGIKNSTADYILFLDGDDQLLVDSCAVLYTNITKSNADIVIGGHINHYSDERLDHMPPLYFGKNEIFKEVINPNLFKIQPAIGAKLFKKELLTKNNIQFPEEIAGQDLVFFLTSVINSNEINVLNNFYVYYRTIRNDSVTFNHDEKYFYGLIKAYTLVCELFEKHNIDYYLQEMLLTEHLTFFTKQINRVNSSKKLEKEIINNILNSEQFKILSNEEIFKKNPIFKEYFTNMISGRYNNQELLEKISNNLNPELNNEYSFLKEYNVTLTEENQKLKNEQNAIKDELTNLKRIIEDKDRKNEELNEKLTSLSELTTNFKNNFDELKTIQNTVINENTNLIEENKKINEELNEIKSSTLWKIKNKF